MQSNKNPYAIIKKQHITEKTRMLENLRNAESNPSLKRFKLPKYVFIVEPSATKRDIAEAVEEIYKDRGVKVVAVNTLNRKAKPRRVRGRAGATAAIKKAIVTLEEGDTLDNV